MKPTVSERIAHINEAIDDIREILKEETRTSFTDNKRSRMAVERLFSIISQASRHIPDDIKMTTPEINWRRLADLGNWLRHAYHRTDAGLVWVMAQDDLEPLKAFVLRTRERLD